MQEAIRPKARVSLLETWKVWLKDQNWRVIFAFCLLTAVLTVPIYYHRIYAPVPSDFLDHIKFTQQMLRGEPLDPAVLSHPALQLILAAMAIITARLTSLRGLLLLLQVVVQITTVLLLYLWFGKAQRKGWDAIRAGFAVTLTLVAPVMLLVFSDNLYYMGYIGLANYHNPTIHLLQPVALLSFMYAIKAIEGGRSNWKSIGLAALWITLSTWIKPNYAVSVLPALALAAGIRWLQHRQLDLRMLVWGFGFPGILMVAIQYLITYHFGHAEDSIILAPLVVLSFFSGWLQVKFILSCLFPLVVLLVAWRSLFTDSSLLLAWAGFIAGAAQTYLLAETGIRMYFANFAWSAQIMLFLLFAVSTRWLLREKLLMGHLKPGELVLIYGAYLSQLAAGVVYYIHLMVSARYY